jgi:hypothetical protein
MTNPAPSTNLEPERARLEFEREKWQAEHGLRPVVFDLAEVGHHRSLVSLVFPGAVPIIVADASGAFCHLGHRGAN